MLLCGIPKISDPTTTDTRKKERKKVKSLSRVRLFVTQWTVAHKAPPSVEFSRQEYWSGLPFPSAGHLPNPGIEPGSPTLQADTLPSEPKNIPLWSTQKIKLNIQGRVKLTYCTSQDTTFQGCTRI